MVVFARALSYILRKVGVTGDKIAKAIELDNNASNLKALQNTDEVVDVDIFDVEVENLNEEEKDDESTKA